VPRHPDLIEQIVRLLDVRLLDPLEVLLEGDDGVYALRELVRIRAQRWAGTLCGDDETAAVLVSARLIATLYPGDRPFDPPVEWWATPLGQTVARRVGHPSAVSVSYATAGAMLGISRQGVHDLVRRGRLPRHPDGGVPAGAIRDRLRAAGPPFDQLRPFDRLPADVTFGIETDRDADIDSDSGPENIHPNAGCDNTSPDHNGDSSFDRNQNTDRTFDRDHNGDHSFDRDQNTDRDADRDHNGDRTLGRDQNTRRGHNTSPDHNSDRRFDRDQNTDRDADCDRCFDRERNTDRDADGDARRGRDLDLDADNDRGVDSEPDRETGADRSADFDSDNEELQ